MRDIFRMLAVLAVIGGLSGGLLAGVYRIAKPLIEEQRAKALEEAVFTVLPEAVDYRRLEKEGVVLYQGLDTTGEPVGLAFTASGGGYQGEIILMVGVDNNLTRSTGMTVLENVETPGLGGKITGKSFQDQFKGLLVVPEIELVKGKKPERDNQVQAITGATISSQAIVEIINKRLSEVLKAFQQGEHR